MRLLIVSYNEINSITKDAFVGMPNLVEIWIDNNNIASLHEDVFRVLPNLKKLYIHQNPFFGNCPETALSNLQIIEININMFQEIENTTCFQHLHNLKRLHLSNPKYNLRLSNNTFNALRHLKLEALSISFNFDSIETNIFAPWNSTLNSFYMDSGSTPTIGRLLLSLYPLQGRTMQLFFKSRIKYTESLTLEDFKYLKNIDVRTLHIRAKLTFIAQNALLSLKDSLEDLNLDRNNLHDSVLLHAMGLKKIKRFSACCQNGKSTSRSKREAVSSSFMKTVFTINHDISKRMSFNHLKRNIFTIYKRLENVTQKIKNKIPTPNIELDASEKRTYRNIQARDHSIPSKNYLSLNKRSTFNDIGTIISSLIQIFNISDIRQLISLIPVLLKYRLLEEYVVSYITSHSHMTIFLPDTLEDLDIAAFEQKIWPKDFVHVTLEVKAQSLLHADLSWTDLRLVNILFTGARKLETLKISGNPCPSLNTSALHSLQTIKHLEMSAMQISNVFLHDREGLLFANMTKLSYLDISDNNLSVLYDNVFKYQKTSMETLILSRNSFKTIPSVVTKLTNLKHLDISSNHIQTVDDNVLTTLKKLVKSSPNVALQLGNTPVACECNNINSLKWIGQTENIDNKQSLLCIRTENTPAMRVIDFILDIDTWDKRCVSKFWLNFSITALSLTVLVFLASIITYRYRYGLEYMCLKWKRSVLRGYKPPDEDDQRIYKAFISYSSHDSTWVRHTLYRKLKDMIPDTEYAMDDKDFVVGKAIIDNIFDTIDLSQKVIFVVTKKFLESEWGKEEIQMTRMHAIRTGRNDMIIVILKDSIKTTEMPKELRQIYWKIVCLIWPEENETESSESHDKALHKFWSRLSKALGSEYLEGENVQMTAMGAY